MFFSLGLPAFAAASHKHEFSASHESIMDQEHPFSHPLQYLQGLQARLTAFATSPSAQSQDASTTTTGLAAPRLSTASRSSDGAHDDDDREDTKASREPAIAVERRRAPPAPPAPPRTTTTYQLAHPPPVQKTRSFKVRRMILQLRQLTETRSPAPTLEFLPLNNPTFTSKLARKLPSMLSHRAESGSEDVAVVNCPPYDSSRADDTDDDDTLENREVVAAIYQIERGENEGQKKAEIRLGQSPSWMASSLAKGGYEFVSTDASGVQTVARWIPRKTVRNRRASVIPTDEQKRFKFSILNQQARRHPVMGYLDRHNIEVLDQYTVPTTPATTPASNSPLILTPQTAFPPDSYFNGTPPAARHVIDTDPHVRTLILVTGVWVAFMEGWSEVYKHASGDVHSEGRAPTPQSVSSSRSRHASFNILHRGTTPNSTPNRQKLNGLPRRAKSSAGASPSGVLKKAKINGNASGSVESLPVPNVRPPFGRQRRTKSVSYLRPSSGLDPALPIPSEASEDEADVGTEPSLVQDDVEDSPLENKRFAPDLNLRRRSLDTASTRTGSTTKRPGRVSKLLGLVNRKSRDKS